MTAIVALYFAIAVYTRPLLSLRGSHIASDSYDPILNASILWWNATTVPSRPARYVRLPQLVKHKYLWRVAELRAHGPTPSLR